MLPTQDTNLRAASERHDNPIFREGLAISVDDLAASIRNSGRGCGNSMLCLLALYRF
jgi:hypothetical protein